MLNAETTLVGVGLYSIPEAARLTRVSPGRIRRWLRGYDFRARNNRPRRMPPVWEADLPKIDGQVAASFLDLIEIRIVNAFREHGVAWPTLRKASAKGRSLFGCNHPFATRQMHTDGKDVFADVLEGSGAGAMMDIVRDQKVFQKIIAPFLRDVEFSGDDLAVRWWPLFENKRVVIDPARRFGQPIVTREGVPTSVLYAALRAGEPMNRIACWYQVEKRSIEAAIAFERQLAA